MSSEHRQYFIALLLIAIAFVNSASARETNRSTPAPAPLSRGLFQKAIIESGGVDGGQETQ